ncbi:MAG: hypothetical protein KAH12_11350, partial [Anaerolineales bacterium]|nr:hypothetical protein [Anaerolineales bacterium]
MKFDKLKPFLYRILFVLLSSAIMVFFSEKTFWYIQGYAIVVLVLYYAVPVAVCLWTIDYFQVQRLSGVILVGGLFGFLVEGILTSIVYEGGLLNPVMPAYFVGWHGIISLVFGWYLIRKWLVEGNWKRLSLTSTLFGLFWGIWSLGYRLPESIQEFETYVAAGEAWLPGAWPVLDFAFFALIFTGMLMAGHWLLDRNTWQPKFSLKNREIGLLAFVIFFLYALQVFPVVPFGFLKLAVLISLVVIPLSIQKKRQERFCILESLDGQIQFLQILPLLTIPLAASLVYGLAAVFPPPEDLLRFSFQSIYIIQTLVGGGFFI